MIDLQYALYWTGGNDLAKDYEFVWQSTGQKFVFTDWSPQNPNHAVSNGITQHCVQVYWDTNLGWDDHYCNDQRNFICEYY